MIPFLPAGFPDKNRFWDELLELDKSGADIIEIGVPFSDPVADGPVVEQASLECLERGVNLSWIFEELGKRKGEFQAGLVLMGYYNPFLQYGLEKLAKDAAEAGVAGFIVPDLPLEESKEMKAALSTHGLDLIPLVGLNTSKERLSLYADSATGFAYFVSVLGTTGVRESLPHEIRQRLGLAREAFSIPLALGFGVKTPDQLLEFTDLVDAVVFGSALIRHVRAGKGAAEFMAAWQ
ncbi:MAG: tryptophan synthase subunit alpha [Thermodesulfobacteriota bacterium]|nr:tryptophan synthase subunit alpha [Thermodesulfobacteriota bacterium]